MKLMWTICGHRRVDNVLTFSILLSCLGCWCGQVVVSIAGCSRLVIVLLPKRCLSVDLFCRVFAVSGYIPVLIRIYKKIRFIKMIVEKLFAIFSN